MDAVLLVDHVSRTFGAGESQINAVNDVSLHITRGEIVLIEGPSGSGKTTLLAMCGGLLRPTVGRVFIAGTEVTALSERQLPAIRLHRVGFVFQSANLLANLTALENIRIAAEAAGTSARDADRQGRDILEELDLTARAQLLPEQLSGGERQRVAIGRALVNRPPVILADEPTAQLDRHAGHSLMERLRGLASTHGTAVVVVTHDARIEDVADRVIYLDDGRVTDRPAPKGR